MRTKVDLILFDKGDFKKFKVLHQGNVNTLSYVPSFCIILLVGYTQIK
jgi:hypothetical protein